MSEDGGGPGGTSPEADSGLVNGWKGRSRGGSILTTAVAGILFLVPGIAFGSMYEVMQGNREVLLRQPIHALDRSGAFGRGGAFDRIQEARDADELFQRQCVACHGKKGKGDGPAAPAMSPRPANLADPERIGELSDEELVDVLTNGRGAMPSFGALLNPDEIEAMVGYIRELSGTETESESESGDPS